MADSLNIKNPSILPGDLDLRTDASGNIVSISGHPIAGGGGDGGTTYYGDNDYIQIKNGTVNTFTVTDKVKDVVDNLTEKIALQVDAQTYNKTDIDTKLSAKQDELVFSGYDNKIETINGSGFIVNGYVSVFAYNIDKNNFNKKIDYLSASVSSKQDKLIFEYDEDNKVSAINGSALAGQGGTTYTPGQYINIDSNNEISVTGLVAIDEYATYSGNWNDVSNSYKTNSGSFLTSEDLTPYSTIEHADEASANAFNQATALIPDVSNFITKDVNDLTNYYPKTQTSSDSELSTEFAKYATTTYVDSKDPVLIGDNNITATSSKVDNHTQWNLAVNVTPVVTDTKLVGDNCVTAHTTQTSGEWIVGLEQTAYEAIDSVGGIATDVATLKNASANWNKVSDKLDTTAAAQTYLEKATYASDSATFLTKTSADNDYAPKTITATVNTLTGASAKWENASNVVATNSANWNAKVDQSVLNDYLTKAQYQTDSATFALKTQLDDYYKKTDTSSKNELSTEFAKYVTTSLLDTVSSTLNDDIEYVSGQVDNKVDEPTSLSNKYLVLRTDSNGDVSGWCDLQDQSYSKSESQGTFVHRGMLDNGTGGTLTGTGLTGGTVLGVNTDVIQTKLTDEQLSAIGEVSSKLDRADLNDYVPYSATKLAIGSNNDISESNSNNSFAQGTNNKVSTSPDSFVQGEANSAVNYYALSQGNANYAQDHSLAQGTTNNAITVSLAQGQNNTAKSFSIAQGTQNSADTTAFAQGSANKARYDSLAQGNRNSAFSQSLAQGHYNSADDGSLAQGKHNTAYSHSLAQGSMNYAYNNALAQGGDNTAKYFSQALGFGLSIQGSRGVTDGTDYISGGLAIGTYNQTSAGVAFVVGNGHSNGASVEPTRSDAFVIYPDGRVSAAGKISANGVELGAGGGALTLPLNIGNNNTVTSDSIGVIGNNSQAGTKSIVMSYQGATAISNSMSVGDGNYASGNAAAFGWGSTAKDYSFSVGNGVSSTNHSYIFGHGTSTAYSTSNNYSIAVGDSVVADNYSQVFGRGLTFTGNTGNTFGGLAIGGWNKTSGNAIFVAGNGSYSTGTSDAFIIRPNGNTEIYGSLTVDVSSGKNVLAIASAATLIGASRQTSSHYGVDNTALGTTWMGVGGDGMHQGFIKYTDGGDVGALDTTSTIQINIKPENAGYNGEMTLTNVNGSTTAHSKVVNVPTASYSNMSSFDNTNGPNYMLRKTASGFDIGAAVINVTSLPQQTEANAYYFVYDV